MKKMLGLDEIIREYDLYEVEKTQWFYVLLDAVKGGSLPAEKQGEGKETRYYVAKEDVEAWLLRYSEGTRQRLNATRRARGEEAIELPKPQIADDQMVTAGEAQEALDLEAKMIFTISDALKTGKIEGAVNLGNKREPKWVAPFAAIKVWLGIVIPSPDNGEQLATVGADGTQGDAGEQSPAIELLNHPSMQRLGTILNVAMSREWQQAHPATTYWGAWDRLAGRKYGRGGRYHPSVITNVIRDIHTVFDGIIAADPRLDLATPADFAWLEEQLSGERGTLTLSLLLVHAYTPSGDDWLTPVEAAELTKTAESGWRNKAAAGEIPGAVKKGKQWLLPRQIVLAMVNE